MMMMMMIKIIIITQNDTEELQITHDDIREHTPLRNKLHSFKGFKRRSRGASGYALASHRWGPEFASRSLNVGFVVDETRSG